MVASRLEDRIKLELHRTVVEHYKRDPQRVLNIARKNNQEMRHYYATKSWGKAGMRWVDEWDRVLNGSADDFIFACLREDELGYDLRQVGPFLGVISNDERLAAIERARDI